MPKPKIRTSSNADNNGSGLPRANADPPTEAADSNGNRRYSASAHTAIKYSKIKVMTLNARSIRSKWRRDIIEAQCEVENYDVLIVTESWLQKEITSSQIEFDNYRIASRSDRKSRLDNKPPGGGGLHFCKE